MMAEEHKRKRRPGAGRKPIGDRAGVCISFKVPEEVRDEIRALIRRRGIPSAVFLIEALQLMKERYGDASPEQ